MARTPGSAAVLLAALLSAGGCGSRGASRAGDEASVVVSAQALGASVATLVVIVEASDIPTSLVLNLSFTGGVASGTIRLPPGSGRTFIARAFDAGGALAYEGRVESVTVRRGPNPPVSIPMVSRAGHVPITVQIGPVSIALDPTSVTAAAGQGFTVSATIRSADGQVIAEAPEWATTDPTVLAVQGGVVTPLVAGEADVVATYAGVAAVCRVSVSAVGQWTGIRQLGRERLSDTPVDWFDYATAIEVDSAGSVYVGGYAMFFRSPAAFVLKLDGSGTSTWRTDLDWTSFIQAIAVDGLGNVYVAGSSPWEYTGYANDAFVAKLGPDGIEQWRTPLATPAPDRATAIGVDDGGDVYVAGSTAGSLDGVTPPSPDPTRPYGFITRLDAITGVARRTWQFGPPEGTGVVGLARDPAGSTFFAGWTYGSLPGNTSLGGSDAYVAELDASGELQFWQLGTAGDDGVGGFARTSAGNLYVAVNSGSYEVTAWRMAAGGSPEPMPSIVSPAATTAHGLAIDALGSIYVTGSTAGALGSDPHLGGSDAFVAKLGDTGVEWIRQLGTVADDYGKAVAYARGGVYVAGDTWGALGGPSLGGADAFVAKLDASGTIQ